MTMALPQFHRTAARYEYRHEKVYYGGPSYLDICNDLGKEGWELAAFIPIDGARVYPPEPNLGGALVLKREVFGSFGP
jgi:hypothetical protein